MAGQKITRAGRGKRFPGAETWEKMPRWLRLTIMWSAGFAALAVIFLLLAIAFAARCLCSLDIIRVSRLMSPSCDRTIWCAPT